jgi:hypothetical protein
MQVGSQIDDVLDVETISKMYLNVTFCAYMLKKNTRNLHCENNFMTNLVLPYLHYHSGYLCTFY